MLVYRICSKQEIDLILNNGIESAGGPRENNGANNHAYLNNVNYLHFFLHKRDILHIDNSRDSVICTYDIPYGLLDLYCGVGKYSDNAKLFDRTYAIEFAIPSQELKLRYLKRVDLLSHYINYENFLDGDLSPELYETIYDSSKPIIRQRKKEESSS